MEKSSFSDELQRHAVVQIMEQSRPEARIATTSA